MADLRHGVYLGFDFGEKNIGVAVGQTITGSATALMTLRETTRDGRWAAISRLVDQWQPRGFVVGVAYQADGSENPITAPTLRFCRQLEGRYQLPVHPMDETLSTSESRSLYREGGRRVQSRRFVDVKDEMAACLILQTWFSTMNQEFFQ